MIADELSLETDGPLVIATLVGEIDVVRVGEVRGRLMAPVDSAVVALVLDLSGVTYLDSAGVHLIIDLYHELSHRGHVLHLVRPQRRTPALVLEVTDVGAVVEVHPDRKTAIAAVLA